MNKWQSKVSGVFALVALTGCAATPAHGTTGSLTSPNDVMQAPAQPRAAQPAPATRLRFALSAAQSDQATEKARSIVAAELTQAGYSITDATSADATLEVRVARATASEGCNSMAKEVSLTLVRGDQPIGWLGAPVGCDADDAAMRSAVVHLVEQLGASHRLEEIAEVANRRAAPPSAPTDQSLPDEQTRDFLAWNPSALRRCRNARSENGCKTIALYLSDFPTGAHAAEARAVLNRVSR